MQNVKHIVGLALFSLIVVATIFVYNLVTAPEENISPVPVSVSYVQPTNQEEALSYEVESCIVLDLSHHATYTRLKIKWNGNGPAPEKIWVWTYFFAEDSKGKIWASEPIEINNPFADGNTANIVAKASNGWYSKASTKLNFYARVNVSTVSSEDARFRPERASTDIRGASSVLIAAN
jgi:hypothetical protein